MGLLVPVGLESSFLYYGELEEVVAGLPVELLDVGWNELRSIEICLDADLRVGLAHHVADGLDGLLLFREVVLLFCEKLGKLLP